MSGFVNPYTFVPVSNGKKQGYDKYFSDQLVSGKISCTLKARTQLLICDKVGERDFDFFKVDGKAVIPGSSIRGSIRNVFETLTDSCFSSTNAEDDDYFSSRLNKKDTGLIEFDGEKYILYKAERYKDEKNKQLGDKRTGDEVRFSDYSKTDERGRKIRYFNLKDNGVKTGYVLKNNRFRSKMKSVPVENKDSIFEKKDSGCIINEKCIKLLEINLGKYESKNKGISENYIKQFKEMKKGEGLLPVWYYQNEDRYYFAPSQMSRAVFFKQPIDMLKEHSFDICSDKDNVCEACAVFGIIGRKGSDFVKASKVRFSDAICEDENCFDKKYIMPISGTPRISSFEFYLKSDNNQFCADDEGVTIAGRKFYWHHKGKMINKNAVNKEGNNMDYKAELVKSGSVFDFDVFFDGITETELKKLIFALNLGENSIDSDKCHKIGHGKPIGLGSAKISVKSATVRKYVDGNYSVTERKELLEDNDGGIFENKDNVKNILKITDMNTIPDCKKISYPKTEKSNDIFKWFADNREILRSTGVPMKYYNKLPLLTDMNQELTTNPKSEKGDSRNNTGDFGK